MIGLLRGSPSISFPRALSYGLRRQFLALETLITELVRSTAVTQPIGKGRFMKRSTAWWVVGLLMLFVGMLVWSMQWGAKVPTTPSGVALHLMGGVGYALGMAIIPLILAIATRFRRPWIVLGTYGLCAIGVLIALHDSQRITITNRVAATPQAISSTQNADSLGHQSEVANAVEEPESSVAPNFQHRLPNTVKLQCSGSYSDFDTEASRNAPVHDVYAEVTDGHVDITGSPGFDARYLIITKLEEGIGFQYQSNPEYNGFLHRVSGDLDVYQSDGPVQSNGRFAMRRLMRLTCRKADALF